MRIPILAGRIFHADEDHRTSVIISKKLAEAMYGAVNAVGQGFPKSKPERTVVGIAGDARVIKVAANDSAEQYYPLSPADHGSSVLLVKARSDAAKLLGPMRSLARREDDRVLAEARLMKADFERRLRGPKLSGVIAGLLGAVALTLACVGIFGLISYAVTLRTREIGIRVALGASRSSILSLLLWQLGWPVAIGIAAGIGGGLAAGPILAGDPIYADVHDPLAWLSAVGLLLASAFAAALVPSRRALGIDPMRALRHE